MSEKRSIYPTSFFKVYIVNPTLSLTANNRSDYDVSTHKKYANVQKLEFETKAMTGYPSWLPENHPQSGWTYNGSNLQIPGNKWSTERELEVLQKFS